MDILYVQQLYKNFEKKSTFRRVENLELSNVKQILPAFLIRQKSRFSFFLVNKQNL